MAFISTFSELTVEELRAKKKDLRQEFLNLRLQQQGGQLKKPSRLREIRRDVARVETVLSRKNKVVTTDKVTKPVPKIVKK
ncbi:MAG: 50S ribosomal protein L29 [Verrucomicrobiota bacterium]|nr:50S ribosomal protein L29 [Verrucomicrobiota bacterium]